MIFGMPEGESIMSSSSLKIVACAAMLLDHVAWTWFSVSSPVGIVMHIIGRITMPVMAFMIAEGYVHTHDITRYVVRLLVFAIISDFPFILFERSTIRHDVIFTLLFGLLAIWILDSRIPIFFRYILVAFFLIFSLCFDWVFIGVLLCVFFWRFRGNFLGVSFSVVLCSILAAIIFGQWWQLGMILSLPLLYLYNGSRGNSSKWGFYIFYPAHLLALSVLRAVI